MPKLFVIIIGCLCSSACTKKAEVQNMRESRFWEYWNADSETPCQMHQFNKLSLAADQDKSTKTNIRDFYLAASQKLATLEIPELSTNITPRGVLELDNGHAIADFQIAYKGVPVCQYLGRIRSRHGKMSVRDLELPMQNLTKLKEHQAITWQNKSNEDTARIARKLLKKSGQPNTIPIVVNQDLEKCLWIDEQMTPIPAWHTNIMLGRNLWTATFSQREILSYHHEHVMLNASFKAFQENIHTPIVTKNIDTIQPGGHLCSEHVAVASRPGFPLVHSSNGSFDFKPTDLQFHAVNAFTTVVEMYSWILEMGGNDWIKSPIVLRFDDSPTARQNGPFYVNPMMSSEYSHATILAPSKQIDSNTGMVNLEHLYTDGDALGHEVGHNFASQFMGVSQDLELRSLHEAIADFLRATKTKRPCIAPTICKTVKICESRKCLRNLDNNLSLNSKGYAAQINKGAHAASQIISGLLWDIAVKHNAGLTKTGKLLLNALTYVERTPDYRNFLGALQSADKEHFKSSFACKIVQSAQSRGMQDLLDTKTCQAH